MSSSFWNHTNTLPTYIPSWLICFRIFYRKIKNKIKASFQGALSRHHIHSRPTGSTVQPKPDLIHHPNRQKKKKTEERKYSSESCEKTKERWKNPTFTQTHFAWKSHIDFTSDLHLSLYTHTHVCLSYTRYIESGVRCLIDEGFQPEPIFCSSRYLSFSYREPMLWRQTDARDLNLNMYMISVHLVSSRDCIYILD